MNFLNENWLVLVSLVVALLGGVPGLLSAITYFRNRPIFHFSLVGTMVGQMRNEDTNSSNTMLLLSGTVANNGPQPLSPSVFDLSTDWGVGARTLIPENAQFESKVQDINVTEPWKSDLQKYSGAIVKGQPVHGFLMFLFPEHLYGEFNKAMVVGITMKLTCVDIYGKSHHVTVKQKADGNKLPMEFPKHGVSFARKK